MPARKVLTPRKHMPEYTAWASMLQRCLNPNCRYYPRYGGRGIGVAESWKNFDDFLADMGPRPSNLYSLERRDNNSGYSKENCCWATSQEQALNRRSNRIVKTSRGEMKLIEVARLAGLSQGTIWKRLRDGREGEHLFAPAQAKNKRPEMSSAPAVNAADREAAVIKVLKEASVPLGPREIAGLIAEPWCCYGERKGQSRPIYRVFKALNVIRHVGGKYTLPETTK